MVESLGCVIAEEDQRGLGSRFEVLLAMHHDGELLGESLLHRSLAGIFGMLASERFDLLLREEGEDLEIFLSIGIRDIEPELIELIRRCTLRVEPYVATLGLAELATIRLSDQRACQGISLATQFATDQLRAGGDITPLIGASELKFAVLLLI